MQRSAAEPAVAVCTAPSAEPRRDLQGTATQTEELKWVPLKQHAQTCTNLEASKNELLALQMQVLCALCVYVFVAAAQTERLSVLQFQLM